MGRFLEWPRLYPKPNDQPGAHARAVTLQLPTPLSSHKRVAAFFLLPDCDIRCSFCISHDGFDVVGLQRAERLLELLAETSIESVVLGGGEPLLWPNDLGRLAQRCRELGLVSQVNTHGGGLAGRFEQLPAVDRFILPIESMDPAVHDDLRRGHAGHHEMVTDLVERLVVAGRELTFATVLTSRNHADMSAIAGYLGDLSARGARIHAWHIYNFLPEGRGGARKIAQDLAVPREVFLDSCGVAKGAGLEFPVYRRDDMLRSSTVEFFWFDGGALCMGGQNLVGVPVRPGLEDAW
jgi:MoaA/NifB/PqqE/SkfB family radical SAM enzyme